ncbi:hypothetical protein NUU61_006248 [Penicillium alfredii]|uniref:Uncharacterized protein n=1 Tax=Penicillium alfredii TaxID=1506179 RepID=A0A9W9K361_9EURO|nr:uncharacterized protein NUU61_006248 [Penicillium alfredii]KAJ5091378.1 hypothetical protein NUU61_006248 [Penicillium alfredii]
MPPNFYEQTIPAWCIEAVPRPYSRWLSFLSLRFVTVLTSMIGVICYAWGLPLQQGGLVYSDGVGPALASSNLGTAAYGFLWSSSVILVVVAFNCAVHPGATITFDLLAMAGQITTAVWDMYELGYYHDFGVERWSRGRERRLIGVEVFAAVMMLVGS